MKDNLDQLLRETYHHGEVPSDALNQTIMQRVKERKEMKKDGVGMREKYSAGYRGGVRKFVTAAAILIAVLLLGTGVAHAAIKYFGFDSFLEKYGRNGLTEEARNLVENEPTVNIKKEKGSKDILTYNVSEVLCDSKYVVTIIDIAVKDEDKYFIVPGVIDLTEPVSCMDIGINSKKSIGDYCRERGMQPIQVKFSFDSTSEKYVQQVSEGDIQSETGKASIMISSKRLTADQSFRMNITSSVIINKGEEYVSSYDDVLEINVEDKSSEKTAYYRVDNNKEYEVPDTSMILQEVKVTTTEVGTYLNVTYKSAGNSGDATEEFIGLCDEKGELLPSNSIAGDRCQSKGNNIYESEGCYESIGLPNSIFLTIGDGIKVVKLEKCIN